MAQSLELLLIQFLMPDNDARRQAEEQIKRLSKDPAVVPALVHHLRTAKTPNVRQLAAVLLRKKITGHWAKLSPSLKLSVKQALIDSITLEHRRRIGTTPAANSGRVLSRVSGVGCVERDEESQTMLCSGLAALCC
ncbi:hypothetical protein GW17_00003455 [Ensete ventricosum]|nr:hypothetical protein GW17_00003455 [Ensete ventricosum]